MKRVLVTGASGFLGRHALPDLIARGYQVHAVARRPPMSTDGVTWHAGDLLTPGCAGKLMQELRPTHLLHLAWDVGDGFWSSSANLSWVVATLSLVEAFATAGGRRVVAAGSCAEYDWSQPLLAIPEDADRRPSTYYGVCKDACRHLIQGFAATTGLSLGWGVLFLSYGADERPNRLVPSVIRSLLSGQEAHCTAGTQIRDFLDSRDAGAAFAAFLDSGVEGAVNIASGEPTTVAEVVERLADIMGRPQLLRLGALPSPPNDPPRLVADVRRLRREVGFPPARSLGRGLEDAVAWWRATLRGS